MFDTLKFALFAVILPGSAFADEAWPRTIPHVGGEVTLAAPPKRVVSTSPSLTGILMAIDAPLVATASALKGPLTDDKGYFLQWSGIADQRGVEVLYSNLDFDIEALILQDPDLVVASSVGADSLLPYLGELEAQGLEVIVLDYSNQSWEQMAETLGRATGHEEDARRVVADFAQTAAEARDKITAPTGAVSIVSYDFAATYGVSKPSSAQAKVLAELGLTIAGLPEALRGSVSRSADFDFISHENLAAAISGDSVFLLSGTDETVAKFMADPVLANLPAVREGRVYPLGPTSFRVDYYSGLQMIEAVTRSLSK